MVAVPLMKSDSIRAAVRLLATLAEAMEIPGFPPEGTTAQRMVELLR